MIEYEMHTRGATCGAVTSRYRSWRPGDIIEAPDGEFGHLPDAMYTARVSTPQSSDPEPSDVYTVRKGKRGWWKVIGPDGEPVDGASARDEEEARHRARELNIDA